MKIRKGLHGGAYRPLSQEQIEQVADTTLRVLEEVGVEVNYAPGLELFKKAGASVDQDRAVVKVPRDLARELIDRAPAEITLHGRAEDGRHDLHIGGTRVYLGTGGTALKVQDPGSDGSRQAKLRDVRDMARMVQALDNIHFYMLNVYPSDVEDEHVDVNRFGAALNWTEKHVMGGVYTVEGVRNVVKMAQEIAGSPQALAERPFLSMVTCVISPLKIDHRYAELAMEVSGAGVPVVLPAEPLCGATSPVTLAGNLVVQNADTLAGVMLTQLNNPGCPAVFGSVASLADMRDMKYLSGPVEMGLINAAAAQMAQYWRLPYYATAGMSDSKVIDCQAGYESAITNLLVALAGGNFIHDAAGFLEFCMTASYDKLVVDDEIIGMVMRAVEGIRVNDATLAFDEIAQVGPGGHFVSSRHTRRHMRSEQFSPVLADRDNRDAWAEAGSPTARGKATAIARGILDADTPAVLDAKVRGRLRGMIPGLQAWLLEDEPVEAAA